MSWWPPSSCFPPLQLVCCLSAGGEEGPCEMEGGRTIHLENPTSLRLSWKPLFIHPIAGRSHIHFGIILSSEAAGSCLVNRKLHSLDPFSWRKTLTLLLVCLLTARDLNKLLQITNVEPGAPQKGIPGPREGSCCASAYWWAPRQRRQTSANHPVVDRVSLDKFQSQLSQMNPAPKPSVSSN